MDGVLTQDNSASDPNGNQDTLFYGYKNFSEYTERNYEFPATENEFNINLNTGQLTWDRPTKAGKYLVGFEVFEYHISPQYFIGKRERMMILEIKEEDIVVNTKNPSMEQTAANVFPNPFRDKVHLKLNSKAYKKGEFTLFEPLGKKVFWSSFDHGLIEPSFNLEQLPNGIYIYQLILDGKMLQSGKLFKTSSF